MLTQTPWVERSFSFDFPLSNFPVIFSRLEGTIFRLQAILSNADDALCSVKTNGWSAKEQLGHLFDMEDLWWQRMQDYLDHKEMLSPADMTNTKTTAANHNAKSVNTLLQQFIMERQRMLESIYAFDKTTLSLTAIHPRLQKPMRLIDNLYFVAEHDDHHIAAIATLLRAPIDLTE